MKDWRKILLELAKHLKGHPELSYGLLLIAFLAFLGGQILPEYRDYLKITGIIVLILFGLNMVFRSITDWLKIKLEAQQRKKPQAKALAPGEEVKPKELPGTQAPPELPKVESSSVSPVEARQKYLHAVMADNRAVRLVGIDPQAADPSRGGMTLEAVYIALDTTTMVEEKPSADEKAQERMFQRGEKTRPLAALEALANSQEHEMVLLGLPGTGKSTFVRYLALRMAEACCDPSRNITELLPGWQGGTLLPVIVSLGRFAESIQIDSRKGEAALIEKYLVSHLKDDPRTKDFAPYLLEVLKAEGGLVLFDGLDEVANLELRPVVVQAVEDFAGRYKVKPASRFLVTCRTYSYRHDLRWQLTGWETHELALLTPEKITHFVDAWHAELSRIDPSRKADYTRKQKQLQDALHPSDRRRLAEIAPFPIILTMMAVVNTHYGELPDTRAQVYERCTDLLLVRWELERPVASGQTQKQTLLDALGIARSALDMALWEVAYKAHAGQQEGQSAALVTEDLLSGVLAAHFQDLSKVKIFLDYCQSSNGLLMLQGTVAPFDARPGIPPRKVYVFPHLTFEEYLAARYLVGPDLGKRVRLLVDESDRWREVVMLLGEHLCFGSPDRERMDALILALAPDPLPKVMRVEDWRALWYAGDLLLLYQRNRSWKTGAGERIRDGLNRLVAKGVLDLTRRAAAADTLDELGWLPEDLYAFVPVTSEKLDHRFAIGRYPVTNAQYQRFCEAEDFADPELWRGFRKFDEKCQPMERSWGEEGVKWLKATLGDPDNSPDGSHVTPRLWLDPRFGKNRRGMPVVGITWYEANAYCNWLKRHWGELQESQQNPKLNPKNIRLPLECEWVAAAGESKPEKRFPWDELGKVTNEIADILERANVAESGLGRTTPVWMYPKGASPAGVWDLAGNVWEWQANFYDKDHDYLVVRGGSWYFNENLARLSDRNHVRPGSQWYDFGFRVVVSPS